MIRMLVRSRLVALVAAAAFVSSSFAARAVAAPAATPEAIFKQAQAAGEKQDFKALGACMTKEGRDAMAGMMAFAGMMMQAFAELGGEEGKKAGQAIKTVFDKHGLTEGVLKKLEGEANPMEDPAKAIAALVKPIKDRDAFLGDMMKALNSLGQGKASDDMPFTKDAKLSDVKIDGDKATGKVAFKTKKGDEKSEDIEFKKEGGGWKIHIDVETMMKKAGPGGPG
jgi:hypothetical protein